MLRICHDHAAAKARPQFGHTSTILRLKGATNPNLTGENYKKKYLKGCFHNIKSTAGNSNDFDQNAGTI
ncbi:MAG: hypothetical protein ACXVLF_04765 [Flavisolibacter sp.]